MSRSSFRKRLTHHARCVATPLLLAAVVLVVAEVALALLLYGPALELLEYPEWRIGARLGGTGLLLAALAAALLVSLTALLEAWLPGARAAAVVGGLVAAGTAAIVALLALRYVFPAGLPGDASSGRALLAGAVGVLVSGSLGAATMAWLSCRRRVPLPRLRVPVVVVAVGAALMLVPLRAPAPPPAEGAAGAPSSIVLPDRSVLLVTVDTLRATHMSLYGYERETTPLLDRWAAKQVVFEQTVTPKAYTAPALASVLSGLVPRVHGVQRHPGVLSDRVRTLSEMFADAGHHTAAFVTNPAITDRTFRFDQGFVEWYTYNNDRSGADIVLPDALAWLRMEIDRPFFLWIHLRDPHSPYRPAPPYDTRFVGDALDGSSADIPMEPVEGHAGPYQVSLRDALGPDWRELGLGEEALSSPDWLISQYDGEIAFLDAHLAPFLETFRSLHPDAVVVLTADHGESLGEHAYMFAHGRHAYEPTARIPMVFAHPAFSPGRVEGMVSLVDVAPTLVQLVGLEAPPVQGRSLAGALFDGGQERRAVPDGRALRLEARNSPSYPTLALRTEEEKLVLVPRLGSALLDIAVGLQMRLGGASAPPDVAFRTYDVELYDLVADPEEETDLADREPGRVRALAGILWRRVRADDLHRALIGVGDVRLPELDPATIEELRSLGYLQ